MPSDYPPGVTGNEPQICGDTEWENLIEWLSETGLEAQEIREAIEKYQAEDEHGISK